MKSPEQIQADIDRLSKQSEEVKQGQQRLSAKMWELPTTSLDWQELDAAYQRMQRLRQNYAVRIQALEWVLA